jgi:hypothetical protein
LGHDGQRRGGGGQCRMIGDPEIVTEPDDRGLAVSHGLDDPLL